MDGIQAGNTLKGYIFLSLCEISFFLLIFWMKSKMIFRSGYFFIRG